MDPLPILALQKTSGIGPKTIDKVLSLSNNLDSSTPNDLIDLLKEANDKYGRISIPNYSDVESAWLKASDIYEKSNENEITIISKSDKNYPKLLTLIPDPPALLHVKGNINVLNEECVAVVGTRKPTEFGIKEAELFGESLVKEGYVVVSGLADGIDSAAHKGSLRIKGRAVAVLAHGLDTIYPTKNAPLALEIIDNDGVLVSEYPLGTKTNKSYFVARDRIQSGLSLGVFVIESKINGGTMHTVGFCEKQKRGLFVLDPPDSLKNNQQLAGNIQLISDKRGFPFQNDTNIEMIKKEMEIIKNNLLDEFVNSSINYNNSSETISISSNKQRKTCKDTSNSTLNMFF